jgi:hypothetical protein
MKKSKKTAKSFEVVPVAVVLQKLSLVSEDRSEVEPSRERVHPQRLFARSPRRSIKRKMEK